MGGNLGFWVTKTCPETGSGVSQAGTRVSEAEAI